MNKKSRITLPISPADYTMLAGDALARVADMFPERKVSRVRACTNLQAYRQVDILLSRVKTTDLDMTKLPDAFGAVSSEDFGNMLVMDVPLTAQRFSRVARVVVRAVAEDTFDFAQNYYSFGEQGALLGRIAFKLGLSLRDDGLYYYFRDGDMRFKDICLTTDYAQALSFLGCVPTRFEVGFATQSDVFGFIAQAMYFNPDAFQATVLEVAAEGSEVQLLLQDFTAWMAEQPELPAYPTPESIRELIPRLGAYFPAFLREYTRTSRELSEIQILSTRLHPRNLAQLTHLSGHELGTAIRQFKRSFASQEALCDFMMAATDEDLAARMLQGRAA